MNQEMTMRDSVAPSQQEQHQQFHNDVIGNGQHQHINGDNNNRDPHTPGFQTNFIDSAFNYLNLQSGIDMNEDIHSLFHMMN